MISIPRSALPLLALLALACRKEAPASENVPSPVAASETRQEAAPAPAPADTLPKAEPARSQEALEQALALDPTNVSALRDLSDLLYSEGKDLDRSDDLLVKALEGNPADGAGLIVSRTVAYARGDDKDRGLRLLERALAASPKEPRLLLLRGRYRLQRHQCDRALGDFEGATRFDPRNAQAYASVGLARLCIGDSEGAAQSFRRSLEIDPDQPEIQRALAQVGG